LNANADVPIIGMVPFGAKIELHGFDFLRGRKIQGTSMSGKLLSLWPQPVEARLSDFRQAEA